MGLVPPPLPSVEILEELRKDPVAWEKFMKMERRMAYYASHPFKYLFTEIDLDGDDE